MELPACWDDERLVVCQSFLYPNAPARPSGAVYGRVDDASALVALDPIGALDVRWHELVALEAVFPWPSVRIVFRHPTGTDERLLAPRPDEGLDAGVQKLFAAARKRAPRAKIERGWLEDPIVEWEAVDGLPWERPAPEADGGGYRDRAEREDEERDEPETIVARRAGPGSFVLLLLALFGGGPQMRELVLGTQYLYGRDRDGAFFRLPRAELRGNVALRRADGTTSDADEVFVFGRRTRVVFTQSWGCPVAGELRRQLQDPDD